MIAYDLFGNPLREGDPIIYSRKENDRLHRGTVGTVYSESSIQVYNDSTGRPSVNPRRSSEVIAVKPLLSANPEWFL